MSRHRLVIAKADPTPVIRSCAVIILCGVVAALVRCHRPEPVAYKWPSGAAESAPATRGDEAATKPPFILRLLKVELYPETNEVRIDVELESRLSDDRVFCHGVFERSLLDELMLRNIADHNQLFTLEPDRSIHIDYGNSGLVVRAGSRQHLTVRRSLDFVGFKEYTFVRHEQERDGRVSRHENEWPPAGTYRASVSVSLLPLKPGPDFRLKSNELLVRTGGRASCPATPE